MFAVARGGEPQSMGLALTPQPNAGPKGESNEEREQSHPLRLESMTRPRGNGDRDQTEIAKSERKLLDVLGH
jgi:hypothetical protein